MLFPRWALHTAVPALLLLVRGAGAAVLAPTTVTTSGNVTIQNTDPLITYVPADAWRVFHGPTPGYFVGAGNSASFSEVKGSSAFFAFFGRAVYVFADSNSNHNDTVVTLDGAETTVSTFNPTALPSHAIFSATTDPTQIHQLVLTNPVAQREMGLDCIVVEMGTGYWMTPSASTSVVSTSTGVPQQPHLIPVSGSARRLHLPMIPAAAALLLWMA